MTTPLIILSSRMDNDLEGYRSVKLKQDPTFQASVLHVCFIIFIKIYLFVYSKAQKLSCRTIIFVLKSK